MGQIDWWGAYSAALDVPDPMDVRVLFGAAEVVSEVRERADGAAAVDAGGGRRAALRAELAAVRDAVLPVDPWLAPLVHTS